MLLKKGYRVVGLARRSTNYGLPHIDHLADALTIEYGDLIDPDVVDSIVTKYQPDEIYNLAAQSVPADSWNQPIVTAEITGVAPVRIMEAVRRHAPHARFYQATSREIYGGVQQEVIDEDAPLEANNQYEVAKLYAHLMVDTYRQSYDMFACGGILFNHESPRRSLHFITRKVTMAVACIKHKIPNPPKNEVGDPLVVDGKLKLGDLSSVRDWGYAKEYVEAMGLMLQQDTPQNYVIGTNTSYSIKDLCQVAFDRAGMNWEDHVVSDQAFMHPTEIAAAKGDFRKAKRDLGWEPQTFFHDLINLMVDADLKLLSS